MVAFAPVTIVAPTLRNYQDSETGIAWLKDERRVGTGTSWLCFPLLQLIITRLQGETVRRLGLLTVQLCLAVLCLVCIACFLFFYVSRLERLKLKVLSNGKEGGV